MVIKMDKEDRRRKIIKGKEKGKKEGRYQGGKVPFGYKKKSNGLLEKDLDKKDFSNFSKYKLLEIISENGIQKSCRCLEELAEENGIKVSHMTIYRILKKRTHKDDKSKK